MCGVRAAFTSCRSAKAGGSPADWVPSATRSSAVGNWTLWSAFNRDCRSQSASSKDYSRQEQATGQAASPPGTSPTLPPDHWFDLTAFQSTIDNTGTWGNSGRNILRAPGILLADV